MTDLNDAPGGHTFHGLKYQHDWESVEHLLGQQTDTSIAQLLGCARRTVSNMRRRLGIPRFRKSTRIRELMGRHPDPVAAELAGVARETVTRQRIAEGVPPCPRARRRDLIRARHARFMARMKER